MYRLDVSSQNSSWDAALEDLQAVQVRRRGDVATTEQCSWPSKESLRDYISVSRIAEDTQTRKQANVCFYMCFTVILEH